MDQNEEYLPWHSIFLFFQAFSFFLWKIVAVTHYIGFMMYYWGCEVHNLKTTALLGQFYNDGKN